MVIKFGVILLLRLRLQLRLHSRLSEPGLSFPSSCSNVTTTHSCRTVDDAFDDKLAILVFPILGHFECFERILEFKCMGQERFEIYEAAMDQVNGHGAVRHVSGHLIAAWCEGKEERRGKERKLTSRRVNTSMSLST